MGAAEDAGTIEAQLRLDLTEMEIGALQAQKRMDYYAKQFQKQGEKGGKMYVQGFGQAQMQLNTRLNNMVSSLNGVSPKLGAIGDKAAQLFSKPIFAMVPAVSAAFQAMLPVIGTILAAIAGLAAVIKKVVDGSKEFNANIKLQDDAMKSVNDTFKEEENAASDADMAKAALLETGKKLGKVYLTYLKIVVPIFGLWSTIIKKTKDNADKLSQAVSWAADKLGILSKEQQKANAEAQKLVEINKEIIATSSKYQTLRANIDRLEANGNITREESLKRTIESYDEQIIKTRELQTEISRTSREQAARYNAVIIKLQEQRDAQRALLTELEAGIAEEKRQVDIINARKNAIEKYEQAERRALQAREDSLISEEEKEKQIHAALAQKYNDLEAIVLQYKLTTGETVKLRDETAKLVKVNQDVVKAKENQKKLDAIRMDQEDELLRQEIEGLKAKASAAKTEMERNAALDKAIKLENDLIDRQRSRAWDAIQQSAEYIAASDKQRGEILRNFNKITEGMKKAKEKAAKEGGFLENLFGSEGYDRMLQIGGAAIDAFDSIANAALEISRRNAEEQIAIVEATLNSTLESIEKARQAQLEAEGFARATTEEEIQKQIDRAKKAGDEVLQYKLERRKEELAINKKYDDMAKAAEEKAAREKAEIEYKVAKQEYALQIIQAANAGAMAILQALKSAMPPVNFVLAGLAGAAAAVQIGFLASNPPKPPQFADGGIVPGRKSDGDVQHVIATAGEVILNEAQQKVIAAKLDNRNGYTQLTVILQVDGREMAQAMADVYGSGKVLIPVRGIAR